MVIRKMSARRAFIVKAIIMAPNTIMGEQTATGNVYKLFKDKAYETIFKDGKNRVILTRSPSKA